VTSAASPTTSSISVPDMAEKSLARATPKVSFLDATTRLRTVRCVCATGDLARSPLVPAPHASSKRRGNMSVRLRIAAGVACLLDDHSTPRDARRSKVTRLEDPALNSPYCCSNKGAFPNEHRACLRRLDDAGLLGNAGAEIPSLRRSGRRAFAKASSASHGDVTRDARVTDNVVPLGIERARREPTR
jgi:hypothetical protein